jgi:predicted Zn-dependent protease
LYGGALAASRLRDHAQARSLIGRLAGAGATRQHAALNDTAQGLALEIELAAGNTADLPRLKNALSRAALLLQARADLAAGRPEEASSPLQTWVSNHPRDALAWQTGSNFAGHPGRCRKSGGTAGLPCRAGSIQGSAGLHAQQPKQRRGSQQLH